MNATEARHAALRKFLADALRGRDATLAPASADASFRRYWRVRANGDSFVLMDAPPDREDCRPWLEVERRLRAAGLHAPQVLAADTGQGLLLLEDLGERLYLPALATECADRLYGDALDALLRMQTAVDGSGLPHYDAGRLGDEMELMPRWFLERHLGVAPGCAGWDVLEATFRLLIESAIAQPRVFVHRDYHSRNLLVTETSNPGIVDFQDAVLGPVTYDLVSLLRDCYIVWPEDRVTRWRERHRLALIDAGLAMPDAGAFRRWFDLMGLQRHIKVLGIFCRLWYRDGKADYLADLPRVWAYVEDVAGRYAECADFLARMRTWIGTRDLSGPAP